MSDGGRRGAAPAPEGSAARGGERPAGGGQETPAGGRSDPEGEEWLARQQARVERAAARAGEIDGPSILEEIAAEDAALRERGAFVKFDASTDHDSEVEILVGRDPERVALVRIEGASGTEGFPTIAAALELALAEWRRRSGHPTPFVEHRPDTDYDPVLTPIPDGVAQCTRCHRRRPLPCHPCPVCLCAEFAVAPEEGHHS